MKKKKKWKNREGRKWKIEDFELFGEEVVVEDKIKYLDVDIVVVDVEIKWCKLVVFDEI